MNFFLEQSHLLISSFVLFIIFLLVFFKFSNDFFADADIRPAFMQFLLVIIIVPSFSIYGYILNNANEEIKDEKHLLYEYQKSYIKLLFEEEKFNSELLIQPKNYDFITNKFDQFYDLIASISSHENFEQYVVLLNRERDKLIIEFKNKNSKVIDHDINMNADNFFKKINTLIKNDIDNKSKNIENYREKSIETTKSYIYLFLMLILIWFYYLHVMFAQKVISVRLEKLSANASIMEESDKKIIDEIKNINTMKYNRRYGKNVRLLKKAHQLELLVMKYKFKNAENKIQKQKDPSDALKAVS